MTIKTCSSGTKVDTKTLLYPKRMDFDINGKPYRSLWFTCPCCKSTLHIKRPVKTRLIN